MTLQHVIDRKGPELLSSIVIDDGLRLQLVCKGIILAGQMEDLKVTQMII